MGPMAGVMKMNRLLILVIVVGFLGLGLVGCSSKQINATGNSSNLSLKPGELQSYGMAVLTPTTITGQEEDRQALAMVFLAVLRQGRPEIRVATLPETLGAINSNGLTAEYKNMIEDYSYTGILSRDVLKKIGDVTQSRYIAQMKLASFSQGSRGRFSVFGLRLIQTKDGNIRLFLTVWDSWDGTIAWEGIQEVNYAYDTYREKPIYFEKTVAEAARGLVERLPE